VAQVDVRDVTATVHQTGCGASGVVHVAVPQAGASNLRVALDGSSLKSIDIERASANGEVQTAAFDDLQRIRFLPPEWKKAPSVAFCAAVALRNRAPPICPLPPAPPA